MVVRLSDFACLAFWAWCEFVWFIQLRSGATNPELCTAVAQPSSLNKSSHDKTEHDPSVNSGVTSCARSEEVSAFADWHPGSFVWGFVNACGWLATWYARPRKPAWRQPHRHTSRDSTRNEALRSEIWAPCCGDGWSRRV